MRRPAPGERLRLGRCRSQTQRQAKGFTVAGEIGRQRGPVFGCPQGFDDGLFTEGERSLADLEQSDEEDQPSWRDSDEDEALDWDEDDPLAIDEGGRQAS